MSRLFIIPMAGLLTGLLWAGSSIANARELSIGDPVRISLMDLARDAPATGLPADSRLTFNRVWADNTQARLCGLATRPDGDLLITDGRLQMKRVHFHKRGQQWEIDHSEHIAVPPNESVEAACGQKSADAVMTAAIKELDTHPPTAGVPTSKPLAAKAITAPPAATSNAPHCTGADAPDAALDPTAASAGVRAGVIGLPGRSLLHSAPDLACRMGKHLVINDKVTILAQLPGWTRVRYTHPLTAVTTVGWVTGDRVKPDTSR